MTASKPKLLSGGNPQIAKGEGDAPVRAYIAAMPGWKSDAGRRIDPLVTGPCQRQKGGEVELAVLRRRGPGRFLSFHCFTRYVKVTFFSGAALDPLPPVESKDSNTRYLHVHEDGKLDEKLLKSWIEQASGLPGWSAGM